MRTRLTSIFVALALCASASAFADDHDHDRDRDRDRDHHEHDRGDHHRPHGVYMRTPHVRGVIRFDDRPYTQIQADPHFHVGIRGYRPHHKWARFHVGRGGWLRTWGVQSWNDVGTITCEAVDRDTGHRYPVSADRGDVGWNDGSANLILDQALDNCYADGGGAACAPVQPPCMTTR